MNKRTVTTTVLFAAAAICYLAAWTGVAIGLGILGMFFEAAMWISMFEDDKRPSDEQLSKSDDRWHASMSGGTNEVDQ
jgi:hypothetical protein